MMKKLLLTTAIIMMASQSFAAVTTVPGFADVVADNTPDGGTAETEYIPADDTGTVIVDEHTISIPGIELESDIENKEDKKNDEDLCEGYDYLVSRGWAINAYSSNNNPVYVAYCSNDIPMNHLGVTDVKSFTKILNASVPLPYDWDNWRKFNTNSVKNYPSTYVKNYKVISPVSVNAVKEIQVGAFAIFSNAVNLKAKLKQKGFNVKLIKGSKYTSIIVMGNKKELNEIKNLGFHDAYFK